MAEDRSSPEQLATVTTLVAGQGAARQQVTQGLLALIGRLLDGFTGWYRPAEVEELAREMASLSRAAQEQVAEQTEAYLLEVLDAYDAAPTRVRRLTLPDDLRQGVTPEQVWERPVGQYRFKLSERATEDQAFKAASDRANQLGEMDVALAAREASRRTLASADKVIGWRRIVRPELSETGPCGLCVVASDRIYHRAELMPLHNGCKCTVAPITRSFDPGLTLNREDLDVLYRAAGGNTRQKLQRVRVVVRDHGELGPVLTYGDHHFRGSAEVAAAATAAA